MQNIDTLKSSLEKFTTFNKAQAALQSEKAQLLAEHDGSLDRKSVERLVFIEAAIKLASASQDRVAYALEHATQQATRFVAGTQISEVISLHDQINERITKRVLDSAPEDIRDAIIVQHSKLWLAEEGVRQAPQRPGGCSNRPTATHEARCAELAGSAENVLGCFEANRTEIDRASKALRKLS